MRKKEYFLTIIIVFLLIIIFINSKEISNVIVNTSLIFIKKIFPSLFIMLIITSIILKKNILYKLPISLFLFVVGLIAGSPTNAKIINDLIDDKKIDDKGANNMLKYSTMINPLFIFSSISNIKISISVILSCIITNLIMFILYKDKSSFFIKKKEDKMSLSSSINGSIKTVISVYGAICFFAIVTYIISLFINDYILFGLLEISTGVIKINSLNIFPLIKVFILSFLISFGGVCIHIQILNILENKKIYYKSFFKSQIIKSLVAALISIVIFITLDKLFL